MATPDVVKFSRVIMPVDEWLERLEGGIFRTHGVEWDRFAGLTLETDALAAKYNGGYEVAEELTECRSRAEVLARAKRWSAWGMALLARPVPAWIYPTVFDVAEDGWSSLVTFDTSMISYAPPDLERGEWIRGLLIGLVAALGCEVAGFGADAAYSLRYEALSPEVVLKRLRAGELFAMASPNFHAIATSLVTVEEMNDLLQRLPRTKYLRYRLSTAGYHVLSSLP